MSGKVPMPGVATLVGLADASSFLSGRGQLISQCMPPPAPIPVQSPIPSIVDFSRAQGQARLFKACKDPRGWNFDENLKSELYPIPASEVADYRSVITQFGKTSRLDGRPPYQATR